MLVVATQGLTWGRNRVTVNRSLVLCPTEDFGQVHWSGGMYGSSRENYPERSQKKTLQDGQEENGVLQSHRSITTGKARYKARHNALGIRPTAEFYAGLMVTNEKLPAQI